MQIAATLTILLLAASPDAAPARDGDVAVREEFHAAAEAATPEALRLFIRRHPDHPLAVEARRILTRLPPPDG